MPFLCTPTEWDLHRSLLEHFLFRAGLCPGTVLQFDILEKPQEGQQTTPILVNHPGLLALTYSQKPSKSLPVAVTVLRMSQQVASIYLMATVGGNISENSLKEE